MSVAIEQVTSQREQGPLRAMFISQPFWVTVALALICLVMSQVSPVFFTEDNFFNVTRNFAFIGILALGMTAVIITRGIDLSVGSVVGVSGIVTAMVLFAGHSVWVGVTAGLLTGLACGFVNGILIAYMNLSSFIVTLGMFAVARSLAQVLSENHMIYQFGPDEKLFTELGGLVREHRGQARAEQHQRIECSRPSVGVRGFFSPLGMPEPVHDVGDEEATEDHDFRDEHPPDRQAPRRDAHDAAGGGDGLRAHDGVPFSLFRSVARSLRRGPERRTRTVPGTHPEAPPSCRAAAVTRPTTRACSNSTDSCRPWDRRTCCE